MTNNMTSTMANTIVKTMAKKNRASLKRKFDKGEMPSADAFSELIDSMLNIVDEGFDKTEFDGLKVAQINHGKLLSFYRNIDIKSPVWSLQLDGSGGGLAFGSGDTNVLTLRADNAASFELDMNGCVIADGRRGREGSMRVMADGAWHNITETLIGCYAFEIVAGVGKKNSGKYALMRAFASTAFNGNSEVTYHQSYFGSKCNRLRLQWVPVPDSGPLACVLQMRVGCSYDKDKKTAGDAKDKTETRVRYYLTNLWFDPEMSECAQNPDPGGAA
jgi:hypothetical protein